MEEWGRGRERRKNGGCGWVRRDKEWEEAREEGRLWWEGMGKDNGEVMGMVKEEEIGKNDRNVNGEE